MDKLSKKDTRDLNVGYYVDAEITENFEEAENARNLDALSKKDAGDFDIEVTKYDL